MADEAAVQRVRAAGCAPGDCAAPVDAAPINYYEMVAGCASEVMPERRRLDVELVARGLVTSRARARDLVLRGEVCVDGLVTDKPALLVAIDQRLELAPGAGQYASRGALKLRAALDAFGFDVTGSTALDLGAAQGGFTEVLLERGAREVYAVENGRGQLVDTLRADTRVRSLEETDARALSRDLIPEPIDVVVADVSFISLLKVLPAALALTVAGARLVALIKPQFETVPGNVGKGGIVRDRVVHAEAVDKVATWIGAQPGWRVIATVPSPVEGGSGNVEFLIGAVRDV
jgi:23S rRNA (cytidine1920-2'-O)/16S rRNA (cytidine1409-2'-O)-methyltransferase